MGPYEVLGVAPQATNAEVDAAYRRLLKQWHPDRHHVSGGDAVAEAVARTQELNDAMARIRELRDSWGTPDVPVEPTGDAFDITARVWPDPRDEDQRARRLSRLAAAAGSDALIDLAAGHPIGEPEEPDPALEARSALVGLAVVVAAAVTALLIVLLLVSWL